MIHNLDETIAELREEFERIREALAALEQLAAGTKRKGRPPKWLNRARTAAAEASEPAPAPAPKKGAAKEPGTEPVPAAQPRT